MRVLLRMFGFEKEHDITAIRALPSCIKVRLYMLLPAVVARPTDYPATYEVAFELAEVRRAGMPIYEALPQKDLPAAERRAKLELTEKEFDKALSCPFCGVESIDGYTDGEQFWLECRDCQCVGPKAPSRVAVVYAWNRRPGRSTEERLKNDF